MNRFAAVCMILFLAGLIPVFGLAQRMPPAGLQASDGTYSDRVRVTWNAGAGATGYEVWRKPRGSARAAARIGATGSLLHFNDTSAEPGILYSYWVKAKTAEEISGFGASNPGYRKPPTLNNRRAVGLSFGPERDFAIFRLQVPARRGMLEFSTSGGGCDIDLYASRTLRYWQHRDVQRVGTTKRIVVMAPEAGTWYVRVNGRSLSSSTRTIRLKASTFTAMWNFVRRGGEKHKIALIPRRGYFRSRIPTWLVIHGKMCSAETPYIARLAARLDGVARGDQVLLVDWESAAAGTAWGGAVTAYTDLSNTRWVRPAAQVLKPMLEKIRATRSRLNLIGHSWGTYMAYEIGRVFGGGNAVNRLVALDPAQAGSGYTTGSIHFGRNSSVAWALHSDYILGNATLAATADQAISVGRLSGGTLVKPFYTGHVNIVDVYSQMLRNNWPGTTPDRISRIYSPRRMNSAPWQRNRYSVEGHQVSIPGQSLPYEAVLTVNPAFTRANSMIYHDRTTGRQVIQQP